MIQSSSRRRLWPAALLSAALILSSGLAAVTGAAEGKGEQAAAEQPAEPTPSPEPTPEPTPFPEFDPGTVAIRTSLFAEGLDEPVYITDDGVPNAKCLYVVERGGKVRIVRMGGVVQPRPFIDISGRVLTDFPEQGLHSIAFHPGFASNGRYFLHYNDKNGAAVITEFKGAPCKARGKVGKKAGATLRTIDQDYPNNNAGWIGFGPDGKLYVPLGDGGGPPPGDPNGVGQTPSTRLSKVLRLDVDRRDLVAIDNPYVRKAKNGKLKSKDGFVRETWAWGLQDPRRSSFDRETGDFWMGDVGEDSHEEVNLVRAGSVTKKSGAPNFGWSHVEGESSCRAAGAPDCDPDDYVPPVHSYDKAPPHRHITGGYVYRGEDIRELEGVYLFSDLRSGYIWGLDAEAIYEGFEVPAHVLLDAPQGFVSFGEDDAGELYLVALDGRIFRLVAEQR